MPVNWTGGFVSPAGANYFVRKAEEAANCSPKQPNGYFRTWLLLATSRRLHQLLKTKNGQRQSRLMAERLANFSVPHAHFKSLGKLDAPLELDVHCVMNRLRLAMLKSQTKLLQGHRLLRFFDEFLKALVAAQRIPKRQQF